MDNFFKALTPFIAPFFWIWLGITAIVVVAMVIMLVRFFNQK